jgi:glycosyltransferase involved in cell wall biosynthesis
MRIAWISTDANNKKRRDTGQYGGVGHYRVVQPMRHLKGYEHTFINNRLPDNEDWVKDYDLVITKHATNPAAISRTYSACERYGVPIVTDLDDDVFNIRPDQPSYKMGLAPGGMERANMAAAISMSNAIFVSTNYLKESIAKSLKDIFDLEIPIYVLPNCFYPDEWNKVSKGARQGITIGWHGSITHDADIKSVLPALQRIIRKYPFVKVELMGGIHHESLQGLFGELPFEDREHFYVGMGTATWKNFPYHLMKQKWDIGIAPLVDDEFNQSKSHIKWMEMSMKGIPVVASDVKPYNDTYGTNKLIQQGKTGFLCKTREEWIDTLSKLIEDSKLRDKIASNAKDYILKNWTYEKNIKLWDKAIKSVLKSNKK